MTHLRLTENRFEIKPKVYEIIEQVGLIIILDVKTGQKALSTKMTSGGGAEFPKFGVFKKAMLRNTLYMVFKEG